MKTRKNNILKISIIYFLALLVISFIILMIQLNYCKTNSIDLITLVSDATGIYGGSIDAIISVFGSGSLVLIMGVLFANFIYAFIIGFVIVASILLIVFISKMLIGGFSMRF